MIRKRILGAGACALAMIGATPHAASALSRHDWNVASRIGEVGLGVVALGGPAIGGDWGGFVQAGASIAVSAGIAEGLKQIVDEQRPDGSGNDSFPSGHTAISFAAAATMHRRYGWEVGVPATLVATFVGVARVKARKHHWYDVATSAVIGEASGMLITRPFDDNVRLLPWGDTHGGGVALGMHF